MSFIRSYLSDTLEKILSTFDCLICSFDEFVFFCNSCFMPELPEVETVKVFLEKNVINEKTKSVKIENKNLRFVITTNVSQILSNSTITKILRRGKYLLFLYNNNHSLLFHLGMTGGWSKDLIKHCHFRVFDKKKELFFKDVRKFGKMKIITKTEQIERFNSSFDILSSDYDMKGHVKYLREKIRDEKSICSLIMNQKYFPGIGNYIKSEALYLTKIHPEEKWKNMKSKKINPLIKNLQKVMHGSYAKGGAELKDFKNPFNVSDFTLKIYGKKFTEKNNPVTPILTSDQRKSWICKKNQKLKTN